MIFYISLYISFILTGILLIYGLSLLIFAGVYSQKNRNDVIKTKTASDKTTAIDILIPCYNEGSSLVETITSLEEQDYSGNKNIYILVKDLTDSSVPYVYEYFKQEVDSITLKNNTNITLVQTGHQGKREKINYFLPKLQSQFVAFLDADHVAMKTWLSQSIHLLSDTDDSICGVQSRREPKSITKFFQIWDSAQNHIGNELLNISLVNSGQHVFFTGTTAVFKADIFEILSFPDSITEDTYLSYDLLLNNKHLLYNKETGSKESVSPTLGDYIARRRRWSNGHNQSFFSHIKSFFKSPLLSSRKKLTLFFHGIFYLIPIFAVVLINIFQWYTLLQYPKNVIGVVIVLSLILTVIVSYTLVRAYNRFVSDSLISLWWILPVCITLSLFIIKGFNFEFFHFLVSFPYIDDVFGIIQLVILLIPLVILLIGIRKIKLFSRQQILLLIISYPLIIFFDIYAIFLGFFDYLFGVKVWRKINRTIVSRKRIKNLLLSIFAVIIISAFASIVILFPKNNCNESDNYFVQMFYKIMSPHTPIWETSFHRYVNTESENLVLDFTGTISSNTDEKIGPLNIILGDEQHLVTIDDIGFYSYTQEIPFGFDELEAKLSIKSPSCERIIPYINTLKETQGSQIFVNNEPIIIKGIAPNFGQAHLGINSDTGIQQMRSIGANLVRSYHVPESSFIESLIRNKILFIPQPAKSNWDETNDIFKWNRLFNRYIKLYKKFKNEPFAFALNFGNELEIKNKDSIKDIEESLVKIQEKDLDALHMYTTFFPYINYSSDILGINMLDTGSVYWNKMIPLVPRFNKPFIATELGGFEAFFERTDPRLRALRLKNQWNTLLDIGGSGAVIFQSHDNWAQPVVEGVNNPFAPDHPDDLRGLWDHKNEEKFILETVRSLFSDIDILYLDDNLFEVKEITLKLTNKRPYRLVDVQLYVDNSEYSTSFSLNVAESKQITLPREIFTQENILKAKYMTHSGIHQEQLFPSPIIYPEPKPFIPNVEKIFIQGNNSNLISGSILDNTLAVYVPDDWELINKHSSSADKKKINNSAVFKPAHILSIKNNDKDITSSINNISGRGNYSIEFNFDEPVLKNSLLIIEGTGSRNLELAINNSIYVLDMHPYRENIVDLSNYISGAYSDTIQISFDREYLVYLTPQKELNESDIIIDFKLPKIFDPENLIIRKRI